MNRTSEESLRYVALLGSLNCWLCGSATFADCDMSVHTEYANARYECSACGALPGAPCAPACAAATTVLGLLEVLQGA